jgi:hypothetical protein
MSIVWDGRVGTRGDGWVSRTRYALYAVYVANGETCLRSRIISQFDLGDDVSPQLPMFSVVLGGLWRSLVKHAVK